MAKIYTRTGDEGETSLVGGGRVRKADLRIETIGSVDEANAALGVVRMEFVRSGASMPEMDQVLAKSQHRLFDLGAELATPGRPQDSAAILSNSDVAELEAEIDRYDAGLEPLREFILPGGCPAAAQMHVARCVCRRAERRLVEFASAEPVRGELMRYLNRLSDLLFVLARAANQASGVPDVKWQPSQGGGPAAAGELQAEGGG